MSLDGGVRRLPRIIKINMGKDTVGYRTSHPQLPLNIKIRKDDTFANFVEDGNQHVVSGLKNQLTNSGEPYIYLWGTSGVGLSHLLQAACQHASEKGATSIYLPMTEVVNFNPDLLKGIETLDLVCIDDIQLIHNLKSWQEAIFFLFNQLQQNNGVLLIAANSTPQQIGIELPDLVSRLASGMIYQVQALSDNGKKILLQQRAKEMGLELSEESALYILSRAERSVIRLIEILSRLDKASLSSHRRLTIPFIKEIMGW